MDWNIHQPVEDWITLEHLQSPLQVRSLPWIHPKHHPTAIKAHPLIDPTLEIFHNISKTKNPSPWLGPLTPLRDNPDIPPELEQNFLSKMWPHKDILTKHFFKRGTLLSRDEIDKDLKSYLIPHWKYMQIRHYLTRRESALKWTRTPMTLENLCTKKSPQRHHISILYTSLFEDITYFSSISCQTWEQDLNIKLTENDWENIYSNAHKGSLNVATQECGYKIITRWYRTPTSLNTFSPQISDRCWRCKQEEGSMLHIWWACPEIQKFWKMVHETTTSITSDNLRFTPAQYLLHHNMIPKKQYLCF